MPPILETKNCSMKFSGLTAVKEFSCALEPGHIYGLIGTNGAGKTSTLEVLEGLAAPSAGTVEVFGGDPRRDRATLHPQR